MLLATFISFIVSEFCIKPKILFDQIFAQKVREYYQFIAPFLMSLIVEMTLCYFIKMKVQISSLWNWFIWSGGVGILNAILTILIFIFLKQDFFIKRAKQILKKEEN